ncbi:MAG TPA: GerMN domain-containing protein [Blastocatellia bacterium]|nr:GerMN domain-containing protein [Blastocatellia bacterium]
MQTREKLASLCFTSLLFAVSFAIAAQGQHRPRFATRPVNIYLQSINEKGSADVFELVPVQRRVSRLTPARGAIEALLAGPTEEEKSKGLRAPQTDGLRIKELIISDGVARISLVSDCPTCAHWAETTAPLRFKEAIELTLKQFDTVRRVKVIFNGHEDVKQW